MKLIFKVCVLFFISFFLHSCKTEAQEKILAEKNGYKLTETHISIAIVATEKMSKTLSDNEKKELKAQLIASFYKQPKEIIEGFAEVAKHFNVIEQDKITTQTNANIESTTSKVISTKPLAQGHKEIRRMLGSNIGKMNFNTKAATKFRYYLSKSKLYVNNNKNYNGGVGSGYTSSNSNMKFCANGTFLEKTSSSISVSVEGAGGFSSSTTEVDGYWDVATIPDGTLIIVTYSTHENWTSENPNGFLPFPIKSYTDTYLVGIDGTVPYTREEVLCDH